MVLSNVSDLQVLKERFSDNSFLVKGLEFIQNFDPKTKDGRIEIDGENVFANVASAKTHPPKARFYECHRDYIDIQYVFSGMQKVYWLPTARLGDKLCEDVYEPENELYRFSNLDEYEAEIVLGNGNFAIFYPEDAHKCLCRFGDYEEIRVCVVKVKVKVKV